jgi:hypothetical protein
MKLIKVLMLASVITLAACSPTSNTSSKAPEGTSASTVISSSVDAREESSSSISASTSTTTSSSSAVSSSSSSTTSSNEPTADNTLTINLFNPTCGSVSTEKLDAKLLEYINQVADTTFVSSVKNTNSQITNGIPSSGEKVLQSGAADKTGSLDFTFTATIKSVTIKAQTYHKPWVDTWSGNEPIVHNNTDTNSVLKVTTTGSAPIMNVDLKPGEDEKPVEKEFTIDMNADKLQLASTNAENGRVFIKSLTFIY